MNVVSPVILPVNVECEEVPEGVGVAPHLGIAGARVMVEGVTVPVVGPLDVAVCHPEVAATAGRLIVDGMRCHMRTEMGLEKDAGAGVELGSIIRTFESMKKFFELCLYYASTY